MYVIQKTYEDSIIAYCPYDEVTYLYVVCVLSYKLYTTKGNMLLLVIAELAKESER